MALIVGALAVALIIGAFFWFAGDTQDTAILEEPATIQQDTVPQTQQPAIATDEDTTGTDEDTTGTDEDTMDTTGTDQDTTGTTSN
jgi:cytoskeletal protein RodZ